MKTMRTYIVQAFVLIMFSAMAFGADLHVPADYATIQEAVDAAFEGDTIRVAPGVYVEQVSIDKNLTVQGQPGTIIRAFPNMDLTYGSWAVVVAVMDHLSNVVLRDLTFEGDQLAQQQMKIMLGVLYLDSGGEVENCRFTGFRGSQGLSGEVTNATALAVWNDLPGAPLYDLRIADNTVIDSYHGISVVGTPDTNQVSLNVTVENNIIHGIGPTEAYGDVFNGLGFGRGVTGSVTGNAISGFSYSGSGAAFPFFAGIFAQSNTNPDFLPLAPMRFENNILKDNNVHMTLIQANDSEVVNNRFEGTGPGIIPAGVYVSGENVLVQGNKFFDMPDGIIVKGDDPIFGLIGGVASNAMVLDNRFRDVTNSITIQPSATATETGNLIYPFPLPELDISPAVLLTWPEVEEGFSAESAPTMDGPWSPLDATYFLQDGMHSATSPTDSDHMFFRLIEQP